MFAGFSGGRKSILPGIAGKDAIIFNHSPKNIDSVFSRFGIIKDNPVHEDSTEAARFLRPEFCINVVINSEHQITKVASGNIFSVFNYLAVAQKKNCFKRIDRKYDIVITGNGGYPLDLNLYQSVKSMTIAELAVRDGGAIISCNECSDGVGNKNFTNIINCGKNPEQIYKDVMGGKSNVPGIWEVQTLARVLKKYKIYFVSSLTIEQLGNIGLIYAESVEKAVNSAIKHMGKSAEDVSILILPKGPQILPEYEK
jgi:nickel-dependent lactate racemase